MYWSLFDWTYVRAYANSHHQYSINALLLHSPEWLAPFWLPALLVIFSSNEINLVAVVVAGVMGIISIWVAKRRIEKKASEQQIARASHAWQHVVTPDPEPSIWTRIADGLKDLPPPPQRSYRSVYTRNATGDWKSDLKWS